jgi:hypothetical protein
MKLQYLCVRRALAARLGLSILSCFVVVNLASAAPFYASSLVDSQFVTAFGSGLVTGPPDSGGLFLSDTFDPPTNLGHITIEFPFAAGDGPGIDLTIIDVGAAARAETSNVFVSTDGAAFTFVKAISSLANTIDLSGIYAGPVNFVKVMNTATSNSPDIDAIRADYAFVPEPTSAMPALMGMVAAACGSRPRNHRKRFRRR